MCEEAARRGIPPYDPKMGRHWQRRVRIVLDTLERQQTVASYKMLFQRNLAVLGRSGLDRQALERLFEESDRILQKCVEVLFPWINADDVNTRKKIADQLRQAWIDEYGDPDDPETKAAIARTVEYLNT